MECFFYDSVTNISDIVRYLSHGKGWRYHRMIRRTFSTRNRGVMIKLYKARVRPHLECSVPTWRPHLRRDVDRLERVQRRATKRIEGFEGISYKDRIREFCLTI